MTMTRLMERMAAALAATALLVPLAGLTAGTAMADDATAGVSASVASVADAEPASGTPSVAAASGVATGTVGSDAVADAAGAVPTADGGEGSSCGQGQGAATGRTDASETSDASDAQGQATDSDDSSVSSDADAVDVTLFGITDFHGHIENGGYLATALEQTRRRNPNTLFVGAGDMVGASAYASSIQDDVPAMAQLRAMGLSVSATGNHEFDRGAADLATRIIPGMAPADYVAANVSGGPLDGVLKPYVVRNVDGKRIAFVGGVLGSLRTSVSPAGMKGVDVTDPIEAINSYADELSDGDESNGEADAVIALLHDDASTATGLDANVDAVLAGHTHIDQNDHRTASGAPILQSACYGRSYSTLDLAIEGEGRDAKVTVSDAGIHQVFEEDGTPLYEADPTVQRIADDAQAEADRIGGEKVGTIAAGSTFNRGSDVIGDLSRTDWNRGTESTLGILQGDATLWAVNHAMGEGSADIGVINPGGMKADLDPNGDGIVTRQEAHDVLPYGNTNAIVTLTGAQLRTMLEQQWQPEDEGTPVRWLGLSSNVTYRYTTDVRTVDGRQQWRGHVFDLRINGEPVRDDARYRVAGNAFLLTGSDRFSVFTEGTDYVDTGFVDLDGFLDYLKAHPGLVAPKARRSVGFSDIRLDGDTLRFDVTGLSFTTDEAKPIAVELSVNGVDLGVVEGVRNDYYRGVTTGPGAGWVPVTATLTGEERARMMGDGQGASLVSHASDGSAVLRQAGGVHFRTAEVVPLFTPAEVAAAKERHDTSTTPQEGGGIEGTGNAPEWPHGTLDTTAPQPDDDTVESLGRTGAGVAFATSFVALLGTLGAVLALLHRRRERTDAAGV